MIPVFGTKCQRTYCQGWNFSLDPINLCVRANNHICVTSRTCAGSFCQVFSEHLGCTRCAVPIPGGTSERTVGPSCPTCCWHGWRSRRTGDTPPTSDVPLGTRTGGQSLDAQGINSVELNDANMISWEELGVTSQICVLKNPCVWERSVEQR